MGSILYQDEDYLCINKPAGIHSESEEIQQLFKIPSNFKAVHRLDKETSGCLLFAREDLVIPTRELFKNKEASEGFKKIYIAGLSGKPPKPGLYKGYCGSRYRSSQKVHFGYQKRDLPGFRSIVPVSHEIYECKESFPGFRGELCKIQLISGARHQLRSFFATLNKAIVGDPLYSSKTEDEADEKKLETSGPMELHSYELSFIHPIKNTPLHFIAADLPSPHKGLENAQ